ncbi:MAG: hypothetical protein PHD04_00380 [Candidatus Pacebacteria bacterium]|nr:hypothetical protein [Candidatus Paceibacterota bacterium]
MAEQTTSHALIAVLKPPGFDILSAMPYAPEDDTSSLELARKRLYSSAGVPRSRRAALSAPDEHALPHAWEEPVLSRTPHQGERHVRFAGVFFIGAVTFFFLALGIAGYFFYFGGNAVSVDKVSIDIQGPTTIAGGDTVPLLITITNKNPVAIENATIEIDFPNGTRDATNVSKTYPHYVENLGELASGATITRSVKAVLFGGEGQSLALPISFSYGTTGSNAVFVKKSSYALTISTTPLSVSVDTLSETVSNKPLTLTLTVRNNATISINNVVVAGAFPFGFLVTSSSLPLNNSSFLVGSLKPGASKVITLTGILSGQNKELRVFHFTVGTADASSNQSLAVSYMTQDVTVTIAAPFIDTILAMNGDASGNTIIAPGSYQNVTVAYTNTLATVVQNVTVSIALSGSAVDYNSIRTTSGFYNSATRTILFSRDTDPALATLSPGASGIGAFTFATLPAGTSATGPLVNLTISVAGTRLGQTNVPENVNSSITKTFKVATAVALSASSSHQGTSGPVPPRAEVATTYTLRWSAQNKGSAIAGSTMTAALPSYVSYAAQTAGSGSFSYDEKSRVVTWTIGDLAQGASAQGSFQVSLTPSTSQKGSAPQLTGPVAFSGYDRFAGVQVSATADPITTETVGDPGYVPTNAVVQ